MKKLAQVILLKILRATFFSTIALTACAWIVQSSKYLEMLSQYNMSLSKFFRFSSYLCVDIIAVILPISFAISSAFIFFRFIKSNQLIALQASGISPTKLLSPLIILGTIITGYLYISNIYISPYAWKSFRQIEFEIKNNIEPTESAGSLFSINGFSVYAREYSGNFSFKDIFILDLRDSTKSYSYYAKNGSIKNNKLFMENGERIEINNITKKNSITKFESYQYDLKEILNTENKRAQPNEKTIKELLFEKTENDSIKTAQIALFHQKITSPLLVFIFSFASFFFILQSPYRRNRKYFRMLVLVIFIIIFQGMFFWITNAAAKDLKFVRFLYILIGIPIGLLPISIFLRNKY